jgi:hypothetical protein
MRILLLVWFLLRFFFPQEGPPPFQWKTIVSEKQSQVLVKNTAVYHNQKEFLKAWIAVQKACPTLALKPPELNFKKKLVIALYGGAQASELIADSVYIHDATLIIRIKRTEQNTACPLAVPTTPCVWIVADRKGWNVLKLKESIRIENCP